ncbi:MAG TPA: hypothetical protein DD414_01460 [Lachnospiraceae bacterium]|nr:hypothetical protein [Lachnospiraceae bacterium]
MLGIQYFFALYVDFITGRNGLKQPEILSKSSQKVVSASGRFLLFDKFLSIDYNILNKTASKGGQGSPSWRISS